MKEIEILSALVGLGWRCDKDEAGDYFCLMDIGEVQIQICSGLLIPDTDLGENPRRE
ncbi:hypothetical protein ACET32_33645, partial [Pseudomonas aeruginosa]